jgi:DNA helicase-2/ATP-dependent DNA helicase PcrA
MDAFPIGQGIGTKSLSALEDWASRRRTGLEAALAALDAPDGPQVAGRGKTLLASSTAVLADLRIAANDIALSELFDRALRDTGFLTLFESGDPEMMDRWDNVLQLRSTIEQYDALPHEEALPTFLEEVALVSDADTLEADEEKVTLINAARGQGTGVPGRVYYRR